MGHIVPRFRIDLVSGYWVVWGLFCLWQCCIFVAVWLGHVHGLCFVGCACVVGCLHCVVVSGGCVAISLVFSVTVVFLGAGCLHCVARLCCVCGVAIAVVLLVVFTVLLCLVAVLLSLLYFLLLSYFWCSLCG